METDHLILRRPRIEDLDDFLAYRNAPESLKFQSIASISEDAAVSFLEKQEKIEPETAFGWIMFSIELKSESRMIGEVGIFIPEGGVQGDIGWSLQSRYQGRGHASEASRELLNYAFAVRKLHRLTANCDANNRASVRIMEKLGMRREGHFVKSQKRDGEWIDCYTYAILREEWRA